MKIVDLIESRADIHDYVASLWKTDAFRESHKKGGFVHGVVDQFSIMPRLFCETTNDRLERAHFSTWWNGMMKRDDYTNPTVADLYWLHEMNHAGTMVYVPNIGRTAYDEKMERNELESSALSEIQIYFEMPDLRAASFNHPIYADRFLQNPDMQELWKADKVAAIETIRMMRRDVMVSKPEHELDLTERWIRKFTLQNRVYSDTWADRYKEVENHMYEFRIAAIANRHDALLMHRDWLETEAGKDKVDHIPFREEAELSTAFYWKNKRNYSRDMEEATRPITPASLVTARPAVSG